MSRRAQAPVRHILPDPKFNNDMLAKFMNVTDAEPIEDIEVSAPSPVVPDES